MTEFEGRPNARPLDTMAQMAELMRGGVGKRLRYVDWVAAPSVARNGQMGMPQ
ncbi:MAG: hypothetical protein OXL97_14305 [Chloroflexota bacterium]|nr:hypothetical protein [Chloroflexota bacterium]MDE2885940.1 hypothetical protein [Chloroflexota bacterium]